MSITTLIDTFDVETTIDSSNLPAIREGLNSSDDKIIADTLKFLGDLLRQEPNRHVLSQERDIVEKMVAHLSHKSSESVQFAGRALGNLAYQDEKNRNFLVELSVPSKLVEILKETKDENVQKNLSGALANVSFVSDELQMNLVSQGIIPVLMDQLHSTHELVIVMTIRAIANIFDETTCDAFRDSECMDTIVKLIYNNDSALVRSDALTTVGTLTENNEEDLLRFVNHGDNLANIHKLAKEDADEQVRSDAWAFLSTLAENEKIKPIFDEKKVLGELMKDVEEIVDPEPLSSALQVLGFLAAHDDSMDTIFKAFSVFIKLAKQEDANVKTYTAMILGNISRKDEYCARLAEAGAIPILKNLCGEDTRVQHLALGALRNIAIPAPNKESVMNEPELLQAVNKCLTDSNNAHVLFNAVLLMKILAVGGDNFVEKIIESGTLEAIQNLLDRKLDEGQERIHYEAARFLVLIANVKDENLKLVVDHGALKGFALLLSTSFPLLHAEAIGVLSKLAQEENFRQQIVEIGMVEELIRLLSISSEVDLQLSIVSTLQSLQQNENAKKTIQDSKDSLVALTDKNEKVSSAIDSLYQ